VRGVNGARLILIVNTPGHLLRVLRGGPMKYLRFVFTLGVSSLLLATFAFAAGVRELDFLGPLDVQPSSFIPEAPVYTDEPADPVHADLRPFYKEFERDGLVTIYLGYGIGTYYPARGSQIFEMLKLLALHYELPLVDWNLSGDGSHLSFLNSKRGIRYSITIGYERNEFARAFSEYEIVMYHGHSRYGQGPAFQHYQNYYRMGRGFPTIEVDTRNNYFKDEPILKTDLYPIRWVRFGTRWLPFQYRGQKNGKSELPDTSYTKNVPGLDVDWTRTRFLPGRQLFYFYSCTNKQYWRESIRDRFPSLSHKFVFGTYKINRGRTEPDVLMIVSLLRGTTQSSKILDFLNTTKDCDQCFTTY